jgi:nucleoside-diphosphate-sugar epimerase
VRILLTGGSGYLGSAAVASLRTRGHEVLTVGRHPDSDAVCDLIDGDAVRQAVSAAGDIDAVVHLAARAHDFRGLSLDDLLRANTTTTRNLVTALRAEGRSAGVRFVHASSVAVYELLDAKQRMTAEQAPYAASKLQAEQLLHAEPFRSLWVLRFAPIYDSAHLQDVAKRVFLPGTRLKLRLCPPPLHSLCRLDWAVRAIVYAVESHGATGRHLTNVNDPLLISQHELTEWFPGNALPLPTTALTFIAKTAAICGTAGARAERLIRKFTETSVPPVPSWDVTLACRQSLTPKHF